MTDASEANDDLKAKMREALERKQANDPSESDGTAQGGRRRTGPRSSAAAPKMHRRKAGGGGS